MCRQLKALHKKTELFFAPYLGSHLFSKFIIPTNYLTKVPNFVESSQAIRAPYWGVTVDFGFSSSTSRGILEKFHIQHTVITPYTRKVHCYHSTIKSALHENRSTFSDISWLPIQSWKVRHIPYRCFKFRLDRCRSKDTKLKNIALFRLPLV